MSLAAQIIDQRVIRISEEQADAFHTEINVGTQESKKKSAAFTFLVAKTVLNLTDEEVLDGLVDGGNDFGVDALYYGSPNDGEITITLIQGKYKSKLDGVSNFPENGVARMIDAIGALFDPQVGVTLNDRLKERVEELRSFVADGAIPRITVILCNNGLPWTEAAQQRINASEKSFGDQVEWRHVGPEQLLTLLQAQKPIEAQLQLRGKAIVEPFDYRRVLIGRISVAELAVLADKYGDRLLERNIRRYLGLSGNRVNEAIRDTLCDPQQRSSFYFYNNGITITCSQFRYNALQQENWQVQISGLQIVNGGQTCRTVEQVFHEIGGSIAEAHVLVRIYELPENDDDLVGKITFATNSQNPVDLRDLKANDPRQKSLSVSISGLGFVYRTKRDERSVGSKELTNAVVAEAVLAIWRRRPHQARFLSAEHFGTLYDTIFTPDLNGAQAITAALLLRFAENKRKRPPAKSPDFLAYGSRFVAMQMGRYLLQELGVDLAGLNHENFARAQELIEEQSEDFFQHALIDVGRALDPLFHERERTLQRLSATFRRADLVEALTGSPLTALRKSRRREASQ